MFNMIKSDIARYINDFEKVVQKKIRQVKATKRARENPNQEGGGWQKNEKEQKLL